MPLNPFDDQLASLPANPFDAVVDRLDQPQQIDLRASVKKAATENPDQKAKVLQMSDRLKVPVEMIERNPDLYRQADAMQRTPFDHILQQSPQLGAWLQEPRNAAVAHDDMEQLGAIEWMLTAPQRAVRQGIAQVEYGQLRSESIRRTLTAEEHVRLDTLKAQMEEGGALGAEGHWFRGAITGTAQQIPLWVGALMQGVKYAGPAAATAGIAGAAVGGPLTAIPLFGLGWSAGMIAGGVSFTADIEAGLALDEYDSFRDELGQPLDPAVANVAAAATGLINGLIEQSQIETLTKHVPGLDKLTSGGVRAAVKTALRVPTVRAALAQAAKTYVGTLASETGQEVAQRGVAILSGELAKVVSGQSIPLRSGPDIAADLAAEAAGAVQTFALMLAPGPLLETRVNLQRARQAAHNVNFFTALGEGVANSKTVQRSPAAAQAFLAEATKDGPISHVYAPVETWTSYWQAQGVDPAAMAARVTGEPEAYQRAVDSGQDLAIPTASYAVTLAGTEHNAYFANELRLAPDQMNARESAAFAQQQLAAPPAAAATTESTAPVAAIREPFVASLVAAGVPKATAESYATVFEHALPTIAERTGVDLTALVQQWLPEVQSGEAPTAAQGDQQFAQPLYHGSPHDFLRFDLSKIGTGEGAQIYGHGLYFAEHRAVAEEYRNDLARAGEVRVDGQPWRDATLTLVEREVLTAVERHNIQIDHPDALRSLGDAFRESRQTAKNWDRWVRAFNELSSRIEQAPRHGSLYQVDIPDEQIAKMLDWDKPFSHQQESVQSGVERVFREMGLPGEGQPFLANRDPDGKLIHATIASSKGADRAAKALASVGIPGIVYLDQGSRVEGKGTRNVVAFDDSIITLTHKDGTPVTAQERTDFFQGERGKITFRGRRQPPVITLFAHRDLSTTLHEAGHLFLELQGDMVAQMGRLDQATLTDQQRQFQHDYLATIAFLGVESRTQIGTEQHEQYARGFEAYLMEGKAPSLEMRTAFARFRSWLLGIYRSVRGLNVELSDEMRGVFDRLLASDQAIAEAEQLGHLAPMFTTAESAGMTPERFELYRATVADASQQAREQVDQRLLADVQREQQAEWQAQRAAQQTTVTAEVQQRPVYRALAAIRKGTHADGAPLVEGQETPPLKLSKAILVDRYGADRLKALPRPYVYSVEGGLDPDVVAEMFGFSSGDALLTAITEAPPMRDVIEAETDHRMLAEHGSILLDGTLHETAQAATANESREEVVRAEMRALGALQRTAAPFEAAGRDAVKDTQREQAYERRWLEAEARLRIAIAEGRKQVEIDALRDEVRRLEQQARGGARTIAAGIPPAAVLREVARSRIAGTRIRELNPMLFWSASRRAAQQAIDHAARQDFDAAITAKQQELVNLALYREAERVKTDVAARVAFAQGLGKGAARERLGLAGESYLDQVDGILDRYSFARVSQKALDRRASLRKWMAAQEGEGLPVDLPEELLEETRRTPYQELTIEELVGVTDGLKQIVHLARLKNKLLKSADRRAFRTVRDGLVTSIREHNTLHPLPLEFTPQGEKWRRLSGWFAALRKIAMLARAMDGNVDGGALWEGIIRPINAAADAKQARNRAEGAAYHAILAKHYPGRELGRMGELTHIPAIGASLSKEARLVVGLNQGTQGNRDRLLADPKRKWNQSQVAAILDTLDRRDWAFIQDTWDFVNTFWPEIEAKQRRVTGVAPEKVPAIPVDTKFGPLRGGYYPLAYDSRLSIRAGQHQAATEITLAAAGNYVRQTTRRGFVEERKQHVHLPLRLELGVMFAHVDQVIHDLTHHEMLIDVSRLLRDAEVSDAILETRGSATYQQFSTSLQDIAIGSLTDKNVMDRSASWMRKRTQIALLGANFWTAAQQPLGLFNGMQRVGPRWVMRGMRRWLRDAASLQNTAAWISEVSPMMRARADTASPELLDLRSRLREPGGWFDTLLRQVSGDRLTRQTIVDGYTWHIGMMQRVADIPTWLGQYEKSMAGGETEPRAITLADQAVIDSQGGGQIKDLASVQRGGGMARLFTMFYSYGSTLLNANINAAEATNFRSPASVLTFLGHLSLLNIMPAMATTALGRLLGRTTGDPDDPEWWLTHIAGEALSSALNGIVLLREATAAVQIALHLDPGVRGYEGPAGTRVFQLVTDLAVQVNQGEPDEALAKAANNVASILFRYPALQVQRTVDGWTALEEGRTSNPFALVVGAPRKKQ